ncbi:MAG: hypothetical protein U0822_02935 [Anaerolineae bacterium]
MFPEGRRADYHSYLLRLWRADDSAPWQASLQSTADGETRHFIDTDSLWAYLKSHMDIGEAPPPPEEASS